MDSFWSESTILPQYHSLMGERKTDVLIIGAGMAGILTAHMLKEEGIDYILLEQNTIASGITKNTTAKITAQHGLVYSKIASTYGNEYASMYLDINQTAVQKFRDISLDIDCDFENKDSYVYTKNEYKKIEDEINTLCKIGYQSEFCEDLPIPIKDAVAVKFRHQAQFNPLKFISAIASPLN
ncbi:MAG: NAD(P)/FAD-dependent oxidoreductase, partial [Acutalibacteraceae bacterium]